MGRGLRIDFTFVPFPQEIWREGLDLTEAEFKLLGYLLYHQARFGKSMIALSDDEMLNGQRFNGGRADRGCGIKGRNNLKSARQKLVDRGWVECEQDKRGTKYKIRLTEIVEEVSKTDTQVSESDTPEGVQIGQKGCPKQTERVSESDTPNKEVIELNKELNKKTSPARMRSRPVDSRFHHFVDILHRYWNKFANKIPFELWFGNMGGNQLKQLLKRHPSLTVELFTGYMANRARSPSVKHEQPVYEWLCRILDYAAGPIGRNGNGNGTRSASKADAREQRIVENVLAYRAATTGAAHGADNGAMAISRDGEAGVCGLDGEPEIIPPGKDSGRTEQANERTTKT